MSARNAFSRWVPPGPTWVRRAEVVAVVVLAMLSVTWIVLAPTFTGEDWHAIQKGSHLIAAGQSPYGQPLYRWSPLAAWLLLPLAGLPAWAWGALHLPALLGTGQRRIIVVGLVTAPFWQDAGGGNVIVFVLLAAVWALRGSRTGSYIYLGLFLLMPRPLMLPLVVWLLWKRSNLRVGFAAMAVVSLVGALMTGFGFEWFGVLAHAAPVDIENPYQIGPSRLLGAMWIPIGLGLAAVLTWKGRLGLASLAASPYWLPYYLLMTLLELNASFGSTAGSSVPITGARKYPYQAGDHVEFVAQAPSSTSVAGRQTLGTWDTSQRV